MRKPLLTIAATLVLAASPSVVVAQATTTVAPTPVAADYAAALADPLRPATEVARDAARHPAEVLAFAGVRSSQRVGDFVMGGGYFTRLLARSVGAEGRVYAFQPTEFIAFRAAYGDEQRTVDEAYANVIGVTSPFAAPAFPEPLDVILTVQNFHDLYLDPFPRDTGARASAALFAALKPGGTLVVIDHSAVAGSGTGAANSLHRIDRAAVVEALTAAGFVLDGESNLYSHPADQRTTNVFDPAIRGQTDQFMLRFRKPA
jgi:predicted methyltransferase